MQTFMFGRERLVKVSLLPEGDIGQKDKRECWPPTLKAYEEQSTEQHRNLS